MALIVRFLLMMWWLLMRGSIAEVLSMAKKGCQEKCGNVTIPYPFGIGEGCYYTHWYAITCNTTLKSSKPFLANFNLEVLNISLYTQQLTVNAPMDFNCTGEHTTWTSIDLSTSPYKFSSIDNVFVPVGCKGSSLSYDQGIPTASCASVCHPTYFDYGLVSFDREMNCISASNYEFDDDTNYQFRYRFRRCLQMHFDPADNSTKGPLCKTQLPYSLNLYSVNITQSDATCRYVFLITKDALRSSSNVSMTAFTHEGRYTPVSLLWSFQYLPDASSSSAHASNTCSLDTNSVIGNYVCECPPGTTGNPYLRDGCQDIRECDKCEGMCAIIYEDSDELPWRVQCFPEQGKKLKHWELATITGLSVGIGSILMLVGCYWFYRFIKRHMESRRRSKNFKRNGGMLLQQQMSSNVGVVGKTKVFTSEELDKATDHFNKNRILGEGGQGTVYKGMLLEGNIVAIKKSEKVDENQVEQFINEVVILSQLNHKNIVKLLGCCLETEVPILVYEFIPSGPLSQYIYDTAEEFPITWEMRLQISTDVVGALAYLHSASSIPIYHRDIKSSNILLDGKYRAKVADFGISRSIAIDKTHLTTRVQGTFGYFDPEYFRSNQLTEKSDVYSFGVVLVELLTGQKPISFDRITEERSLVTYFLSSMERSSLFDILNNRVLKEGRKEEIEAVANLAKQCLNWEGKQRPTMKEAAFILEGIRSAHFSSSMPPNLLDNKTLETKICDIHDAPFTSTTFSLDEGPSSPIDDQPLSLNTI